MSNKLLIVNSSLPEVDSIMLSLRENVNVVLYDETKDYFELLAEIQKKETLYTHVGFMFVNNSNHSDNWLNISEKNVVQCVEMADSNLSSWSNFDNFLRKLKKMVCFKFFDLVTCNAYDNDWKYIINTFKQRGIYMRASVNITGYEGDWILESDNVDMREVYFNEKIMDWKHSLEYVAENNNIFIDGTEKGTNYLISSTGALYGFGSNSEFELGVDASSRALPYKSGSPNITGRLAMFIPTPIQIPLPSNKTVKEMLSNPYLNTYLLTNDGLVYSTRTTSVADAGFKQINLPYPTETVTAPAGTNRLLAKQVVVSSCQIDDNNTASLFFLMSNNEVWIKVNSGNSTAFLDFNNSSGQTGTQYLDGFFNVSKKMNSVGNLVPIKIGVFMYAFFDKSQIENIFMLMSNRQLYKVSLKQNSERWNYDILSLPQELLTNNNKIIDFACGSNHMVILMKNGEVATMGSNNAGQLAIGKTSTQLASSNNFNIVTFPDNEKIRKVACGYRYNIFLTTTGKVYSNGNNLSGQLGLDIYDVNINNVTEIKLNGQSLNAKDIYVHVQGTFIQLNNGDIYACGSNQRGQLGIGMVGYMTDSTSLTISSNYNMRKLVKLTGLPVDVSFSFSLKESSFIAKNRGMSVNDLFTKYSETDFLASGVTISEAKSYGITDSNKLIPFFSLAELVDAEVVSRSQALSTGYSSSELKLAGFTPQELLDASYSRNSILTAGFVLESLLTAKFEISELKPYFSVQDMFDNGVSVTKLLGLYDLSDFAGYNFTVSYLKGFGYKAKDFKDNNFSIEKILDTANVKFSSTELLEASYNVVELKTYGYSASELRANDAYSVQQVVQAGYSLAQLKAADITPSQIKQYSTAYSDSQILNAGFSLILLKNANLDILDIKSVVDSSGTRLYTDDAILSSGFLVTDLSRANYSVSQLKSNGYRPVDLKDIYPDNQIISAGYDISLIKIAGYMPSQIYQDYTVQEMRRVNYTKYSILSTSGIDASQCRVAGYGVFDMRPYFSPSQLRVGGYNDDDILNKDLKYTVAQYKAAGYTPSQLKEKGHNNDDILKAGYDLSLLVAASYTVSQVRPYYSLSDIKDAYDTVTIISELAGLNFSLADLISNGFGDNLTVANMRHTYTAKQIKDASSQWIDAIINNEDKFPASQMLEASFNVIQIAGKYSPDELKQGGYSASAIWSVCNKNIYTVQQMTNKVFTAKELADNGFDVDDIVQAKYSVNELKLANIPLPIIFNAVDNSGVQLYSDSSIILNYNLTELKNDNYPVDRLMTFVNSNPTVYSRLQVITERFPAANMKNYFSVLELIRYKYEQSEIIAAGYDSSALVPYYNPGLLVNNYTKEQILNAGYTISRLRNDLSLNPTELKNSTKYGSVYTDSLIIGSNFTIQELKDASYSPLQIKNETNAYYVQMLTVGYSLTELFDASYSPKNIKDIQTNLGSTYYSDDSIGSSGLWPVSQLREAGFIPSQLKTYVTGLGSPSYSDEQILSGGFSIALLKDADFSPNQLLNSTRYSLVDIVNANYSASVMFDNSDNFTPFVLKQNNTLYSLVSLKTAGYSDKSLIEGKYPIKDYKDNEYTLDTLISYGLKPVDLRDFVTPTNGFSDSEILSKPFSILEFKQGRFTVSQVKTAKGFTDKQLKDEGFTADDFDKSGYSLAQLISFGDASGAKFKQSEIFTVKTSDGESQKYKREHILNCGIPPDSLATLRGTSAAAKDTQIPMCQLYQHIIQEKRSTDRSFKIVGTKYYDLNTSGVYIREFTTGTTKNNNFTKFTTYTEYNSNGGTKSFTKVAGSFNVPNVEVMETKF